MRQQHLEIKRQRHDARVAGVRPPQARSRAPRSGTEKAASASWRAAHRRATRSSRGRIRLQRRSLRAPPPRAPVTEFCGEPLAGESGTRARQCQRSPDTDVGSFRWASCMDFCCFECGAGDAAYVCAVRYQVAIGFSSSLDTTSSDCSMTVRIADDSSDMCSSYRADIVS